jgi:hypothetical protein
MVLQLYDGAINEVRSNEMNVEQFRMWKETFVVCMKARFGYSTRQIKEEHKLE